MWVRVCSGRMISPGRASSERRRASSTACRGRCSAGNTSCRPSRRGCRRSRGRWNTGAAPCPAGETRRECATFSPFARRLIGSPERMIGEVAWSAVDAEDRASLDLSHRTAGFPDGIARFLDKAIHHQAYIHGRAAFAGLGETSELGITGGDVTALGQAGGAQFVFLEGFKRRAAGVAQVTADEFRAGNLIKHDVEHPALAIDLCLKNRPSASVTRWLVVRWLTSRTKHEEISLAARSEHIERSADEVALGNTEVLAQRSIRVDHRSSCETLASIARSGALGEVSIKPSS